MRPSAQRVLASRHPAWRRRVSPHDTRPDSPADRDPARKGTSFYASRHARGVARVPRSAKMGMLCHSNISSSVTARSARTRRGSARRVGAGHAFRGSHHAFLADPCSFAMASNSYLQSVYPMPIPTPAPRPAAAVRADGVPARAQRIDARNAVKRESTHACKAALCHGISHTPEQEFCEAVGQRAYGTESSRPAPPQARRTPTCARCSLCTGPMSRRPAKTSEGCRRKSPSQ